MGRTYEITRRKPRNFTSRKTPHWSIGKFTHELRDLVDRINASGVGNRFGVTTAFMRF